MKLTTRLTILLLLLSTVPLVLIAVTYYLQMRRAFAENMVRQLMSVTDLREATLDRWMDSRKKLLEDLALNPELRSALLDIQRNGSSGRVDLNRETAYLQIQGLLLTALDNPGISHLSLLDGQNGVVLYSTDDRFKGLNHVNRPYFIDGITSTYIDRITFSPLTEQFVMPIGTPVRNFIGNAIGVLALYPDFDMISRIMTSGRERLDSEETYIVNEYNFFVTESRFIENMSHRATIYTEGVSSCLKGKSGSGAYPDYRGVPILGYYRWLPDYRMCMLTEIDQAVAYRPVRQLRNAIIITSIVIFLTVFLLGLLMNRSIRKKIQLLVDAARRFGKGDLAYRIPHSKKDEIGMVITAMNEMAQSRRLAEQQLASHRDDLEKRVQERTIDLSRVNKALKQEIEEHKQTTAALTRALEKAEEASQAKSRFLSSVSHELRTPLNAMIGFTDVLAGSYYGPLNEKQEQYLLEIRDAGDHLLTIISEILDIAAIDTGQMVLNKSIIDLPTLLETSVSMARQKAAARRIDIFVHVSGALKSRQVLADDRALRQILFQLLSNAIKFTPDHGAVYVSAESKNGAAIIDVSDTGCGLAAENTERIFEPFFQISGGLQNKTPGTGLGLTLVASLVKLHGGSVRVDSEGPEMGSRFRVTLPHGSLTGNGNEVS